MVAFAHYPGPGPQQRDEQQELEYTHQVDGQLHGRYVSDAGAGPRPRSPAW